MPVGTLTPFPQRLARQLRSSRPETRPKRRYRHRLGSMLHDTHVTLANKLADKAAEITTAAFRQPMKIYDKEDTSPVTEIDRKVEIMAREEIHAAFPKHSVYGEEYGLEIGAGDGQRYLWVLDPIDGTLSFITGKPLFGTLIALLYDGVPILGIIDQPVLKDRWLGGKDIPTTWNGRSVKTRPCPSLSAAYVYSTTPDMFDGETEVPYHTIQHAAKGHLYGADCYAYGLLSAGMTDVVLEADMQIFDYAPMVPIIEGAGGVITDWSGRPLRWDGVKNNGNATWSKEVLAVGDPTLHPEIIRRMDYTHRT